MKKILSLILALSILLSFTVVMAGDNAQLANELTMPGWTIAKSSNVTIERVYDEVTGKYAAKITSLGKGSSENVLRYIIPKDKLVSGHTYSAKVYVRAEASANNYVAIHFAGTRNSGAYLKNDNCLAGHYRTINQSNDMTQVNNYIGFGLTHAAACVIYIEDIVITDTTTGEVLALENIDFGTTISCTEVENADYTDGILTWNISENSVGDAINVYKRDLDGEKTLLTESPVSIENGSLELTIQSENSYYIDIYTCYNRIEDLATLVSIPMLGKTDFGVYKLFSGEDEINSVQPGTLTVKVPFINREFAEGFGFEIIVLVKDDITILNSEHKAFNVEITADFVDYTVDIDVEEITENTSIEVLIWDGIKSMNVIRDVIVF